MIILTIFEKEEHHFKKLNLTLFHFYNHINPKIRSTEVSDKSTNSSQIENISNSRVWSEQTLIFDMFAYTYCGKIV